MLLFLVIIYLIKLTFRIRSFFNSISIAINDYLYLLIKINGSFVGTLLFLDGSFGELTGRDVSLTVLCPGPVRTAFWDIGNETYALKRLGRADAFWMTDAPDVVRHTLRAARKGKAVVTYGFWNGWHRRLAQWLPWSWIMAVSRKLI